MERFIAIFISIALICGTLIGCSGSSNNNENGPTLNSDSQREEGVSFEQDDSSATLNTEKEEPSNSVSDIDEKIEIAGYRVYEKEGEYIYFDILVLNATNKVINNVGIDINIIDDDGNITDTTYPNETLRVLPRQIIALQGIVQADKAGNISAEKYTYLDDEGKIYEDYFEDVKTISLLDVKTMYYISYFAA